MFSQLLKQALVFEEHNVNDYTIVRSETPSMTAITACFWANLTAKITGSSSFVSYAASNISTNTVLIWFVDGHLHLTLDKFGIGLLNE